MALPDIKFQADFTEKPLAGKQRDDGAVAFDVSILGGVGSHLVSENWDYCGITYTGNNPTTLIYRTGGSTGTIVATIVLTWDASDNLTSIARA